MIGSRESRRLARRRLDVSQGLSHKPGGYRDSIGETPLWRARIRDSDAAKGDQRAQIRPQLEAISAPRAA
jgi:hypothetical protein